MVLQVRIRKPSWARSGGEMAWVRGHRPASGGLWTGVLRTGRSRAAATRSAFSLESGRTTLVREAQHTSAGEALRSVETSAKATASLKAVDPVLFCCITRDQAPCRNISRNRSGLEQVGVRQARADPRWHRGIETAREFVSGRWL